MTLKVTVTVQPDSHFAARVTRKDPGDVSVPDPILIPPGKSHEFHIHSTRSLFIDEVTAAEAEAYAAKQAESTGNGGQPPKGGQ